MKYALIGNPNSGKTTLFNQLTGSNQHVGNFPGITVEKKEGFFKSHPDTLLVDLPGIYSLSPYSQEEVVTRDFLLHEDIDLFINIVDATNIQRNLYLSLQLMELGKPMIMALNMMDEVRANGDYFDVEALSQELGIPVIPIAAAKNQGLDHLLAAIDANNILPPRNDFCQGPIHRAIHSISHLLEEKAAKKQLPLRFAAIKIIEGDEFILRQLKLSPQEKQIIEAIIKQAEMELVTDREAAVVDMRYAYIEKICDKYIKHQGENNQQRRSQKIDGLLTHKIWSIPVFLTIMLFIFWMTFGPLGAALCGLLEKLVDVIIVLATHFLEKAHISSWLQSLLVDGVLVGIGSVISFLPTIVLLFFFLSLLEDSGYMARVAFVMDRLLRKIGLSGRSFIPLLMGFGCSVPAVLATRTLSSPRDRLVTILLVPFMSCSAKLPIYVLFTAAFFPGHKALVMFSLYLLGILLAIICGFFLRNIVFKGAGAPFIMELPAYRWPSGKNLLLNVWDKSKGFVHKAFTIIFMASIVIWFLQSFDSQFNMVGDSSKSMLASLGMWLAPLFAPLGFGDWQAATALLAGISAKEAVVSTLSVLLPGGDIAALFTPLTAYVFLVFTLLYMPCLATVAVIKKEFNSWPKALLAMLWQISVAWVVAFIVYRLGILLLG